MKIKSHIPPTIFESKNGRWAVSGSIWLSIGPNVTLDDVRAMWEDTSPLIRKEPLPLGQRNYQEWEVKSSSTKEVYTVKLVYGNWSCSCIGFGYRHKCKHIENQRVILNNAKSLKIK